MHRASVTFKHASARVDLKALAEDIYMLHSLYSIVRSKGHARNVMQKAVDYADKRHLTLILKAQSFADNLGLDNKALVEFYKKFGFVETELRSRPVRMTRFPSQDLQAP